MWKCLLVQDHIRAQQQEPASHEALLAELARLRASKGQFVVVLMRGGHFAAAVFRAKPPTRIKEPTFADLYEVVAHKTFHRYVVRWVNDCGCRSGCEWCGKGVVSEKGHVLVL